ncbi:MAG: SGNH/GDSL hydrolase family protein [Planctomycetes bacterium]|nr:SGNH/GDSL hydrolase family protein [Planctomycetota bacterium]
MNRLQITSALALLALLPARGDSRTESPLARIGVIGASVSDGVGPGPALSSLLRAGLEREAIVVDRANTHFGADPLGTTERAVAQLHEGKATLVVAADVFFWYGYRFSSQEEREAKLAAGLAALDQLDCPLLVGTVPQLTARNIPPQNQPTPEQLARLNAEIAEWASARENVRLLPLDRILDAFREGKPITLAGESVTADPATMLQPDGIHLTLKGQTMLGMLVLDAIRELPQVSEGDRSCFVRQLEVLRTRAVELDRTKALATPTLRALKHLSRQADGGPVEADKVKDVLSRKLEPEDVERALAWLESEHALEREGTRLTPIKGIEPVRR